LRNNYLQSQAISTLEAQDGAKPEPKTSSIDKGRGARALA